MVLLVRMPEVVAGELGDPLTAIGLQVHLLERRLSTAEARGSLAIVRRNVAEIQRLVRDLRELARLERGDLSLDVATVDVADLVRAAATPHAPAAEAADVRLDLDLAAPAPARADPARLAQAFEGLVLNAIRATPRGGRVRVRVFRDGAAVAVEVAAGARAGNLDGVGPYVARAIVRAHGGTVGSERSGRGSLVLVRLPAAASAHGAREAVAPKVA